MRLPTVPIRWLAPQSHLVQIRRLNTFLNTSLLKPIQTESTTQESSKENELRALAREKRSPVNRITFGRSDFANDVLELTKKISRTDQGSMVAALNALSTTSDAKLYVHDPRFMRLLEITESSLHRFTNKGLAIIFSTYCELGVATKDFIDYYESAVANRMQFFDTTGLCRMVLSFSRQHPRPNLSQSFVNLLSDSINATMKDMDSSTLATIAFGLGKAKIHDHALFGNIAEHSARLLPSTDPHFISSLTHGFAQAGMCHQELFGAVAEEVIDRLEEFTPKDLLSTVSSFGELGIKNTPVFSAAVPYIIDDPLPQANLLAKLLFETANIGLHFNQLYDFTMELLGGQSLEANSLTRLMSYYALVEKEPHPIVIEGLKMLSSSADFAAFQPLFRIFLFQSLTALRRSTHKDELLSLYEGLRSELDAKIRQQSAPDPADHSLIEAMRMMVDSDPELASALDYRVHYTTELWYPLKVAIPQIKVGLEVLEESAYVSDLDKNELDLTGVTKLKYQLLEQAGWKIAKVPFMNWNAMESEQERVEALRALFQEVPSE
eukprot:Colp12_sorted_trinity150504_noHs@24219